MNFFKSYWFGGIVILIVLAIGFVHKINRIDRIKNNATYTIGIVEEKIKGPKYTNYIKYKYKFKEQLIVNQQSLTTFSVNGNSNVKKGNKYLVIFNAKNINEALIIDIKVEGKLGDKYENFSIEKLIKDGYIKIFL